MIESEAYMYRCIELAQKGAGYVAPNPLVGAVLVHEGVVIAEGYHRQYGQAHAEVNCIRNVPGSLKHLIPFSTLYVSLEPCSHHGKTPPCADLIINHKIPNVVIGCKDVYHEVSGRGIQKLQNAGVNVTLGVLENKCIALNKRFFTFHQKQRPYIILKWAQTANGKIAGKPGERLFISKACTNRLVHRWRSEEAAIMVGTNTAMLDNPSLTVRLWPGNNPTRLVTDRTLRLAKQLAVFDNDAPTVIFHQQQNVADPGTGTRFHEISGPWPALPQILEACYQMNIQSILVEGGATL